MTHLKSERETESGIKRKRKRIRKRETESLKKVDVGGKGKKALLVVGDHNTHSLISPEVIRVET